MRLTFITCLFAQIPLLLYWALVSGFAMLLVMAQSSSSTWLMAFKANKYVCNKAKSVPYSTKVSQSTDTQTSPLLVLAGTFPQVFTSHAVHVMQSFHS